MNIKKTGTLYGIGVGPGDPDLITLKSVKILRKVDLVFAASSTKNAYSLAVSIAKPHIPKSTKIKMLSFPMTKEIKIMEKTWKEHAQTIISELEQGKDIAFLTLGDSMTYSTYGYILKHVQVAAPHINVTTIPGITSYQAAAARLNTPLVQGEESLLIMSGVKGGDRLRRFTGNPENMVFLKAYKNVKDITSALEESDLLDTSVGVINCCLPDEEIIRNVRKLGERPPGYWTLIIAKQKKENAQTED